MNLSKRYKASNVYIIAFLFVLLVVSGNKATTNKGVVIPFIEFNAAYLILAVIMLGMIYLLFKKNLSIRLDFICGLLFARIVLNVLPMLYMDVPPDYFGNFVEACFPLFLYLFFLNMDLDVKCATRIFLWFGVVVAFQCFLAYILIVANGYATYMDLWYKDYFVIPLGATNLISGVLLPLLILGDRLIERMYVRYAFVAALAFAIVLCKSRTGLILLFAYLVLKLFLKRDGGYSKAKKIIWIVTPMLIPIAIIFLLSTSYGETITSVMMGYASSGKGFAALFSGRFEIYKNIIEYTMQNNFLIGSGVSYIGLEYTSPHNVLLQFFYQNGIIGCVGFIIFILVVIKLIFRQRNKSIYFKAVWLILPFIFINAMVEDTIVSNFMILFGLYYVSAASQKKIFGGK